MRQALPRRIFWSAALLAGAAGPLTAQEGEDPTIDRIVAVVGSAAITKSQVDEELFARQGAGMLRLPDDPVLLSQLRRQIVDTLVAEELLYQEALRDTTIKVTAQEVSDAVRIPERRGVAAASL
jgi:parvulin-like peptidyl-prolyl isomerase